MKNKSDIKLILHDKSMSDEEKLEELQQMGYELEEILNYLLKNY